MKKIIKLFLSITTVIIVLSATNVFAENENHGTGLKAMTAETKEMLENSGHMVDVGNIPVPYSMPSSVDNSQSTYFPEIADQGNTNACAGYSTTYYQMSYMISKKLNTNYVFNPLWTYSLINGGEDNGAYDFDAYDVISNLGAPLYDDFTGSSLTIESDADVWKSAMKYKIDADSNDNNWNIICDDGDTDAFITDAKSALNAGNVLVTGTMAYWWYGSDDSDNVTLSKNGTTLDEYGIPYIYNQGSDSGRHFVTIVGYDDDIVMSYTYNNQSYTTTGAFKIANSWGSYWGNDGFIWVAYDAFYKNSTNRPSVHNGYGFTSAWYCAPENSSTNSADYGNESVYYIMCLDDDYTLYSPQYTLSIDLNGTNLQDFVIYYKTKTSGSSAFSSGTNLFSESEIFTLSSSLHHEFPTNYAGGIAIDISNMADYMSILDNHLWKIYSTESDSTTIKIYNTSDSLLYSSTGTEWYEQHKHTFNSAVSDDVVGNATRTCSVCNKTITVNLSKNFENGVNPSQWKNNGNAVISSVTEENGNTYMQLDYEQSENSSYNYYEIYYPDEIGNMNISGNMYMSYDIYYGANAEEVMLTNATSFHSAHRDYVLRLCRDNNRLEFGGSVGQNSNRYGLYDDVNETFVSAIDRWFTVEVYANINEKGAQSIYVKDRDTGDLIAKVEEFNIAHPTNSCNLFLLGGRNTLKIDNIIITQD